jgi:hypothetical protein
MGAAGTITAILLVFAVVSSDVSVTVKTRFTVVAAAGGVIVPLVATTPVLLDVAMVMVKPLGTVGEVKLVAPGAGAGIEVIPPATVDAVWEASV